MKDADRRRAGRPGIVILALLVGTTAAALALTLSYHLGVPGLVVTVLLGLPALYLGWVALQDARRPPDRSLAQIADDLAGRLRSQWASEAETRRLNDPYPLPVAWTAADPPLAGDLDALKTLAISGAGWSATSRGNWAEGPEDLAGGGDRKLADVLAAVPTGRLVVLGEPGTGKTMLMVGLVLDLLHPARRSSGGPVPVLATLASWDPANQDRHDLHGQDRHDLHGWLGATLIIAYPDLAAVPPPGSAGNNRFEALLEAGLILPVLDGLDEIPDEARPTAITRINSELKPGEQVVVTCRTEQYQAAVSPQDGQGAILRAAAVQLSTLPFGEVASYLRTDAGPAEGRWDFLDTLSAESPARQALATPLMAGLARAIYNPRPGERARDLRHPAELGDFTDRSAVEAYLFDAFIPGAYRPPTAGRWTARQAERWLVFLARHLEQTIGGPDLAWWELPRAGPLRIYYGILAALVVGLGAGLAGGLLAVLVAALSRGHVGGLLAVLAAGLAGGLAAVLLARLMVEGMAVGLGIAGAAVGGCVGALGLGLAGGLAGGLVVGPMGGLAAGLAGLMASVGWVLILALGPGPEHVVLHVRAALTGITSPGAVLARNRHLALLLMPMSVLVFGLAGALAGGRRGLVVGLTVGLVFGLGLSMIQTSWPSYTLTRAWLALRRRLPWSLMKFLADAHQRGVLRQAGAVYQFRHLELQRRLGGTVLPDRSRPTGRG